MHGKTCLEHLETTFPNELSHQILIQCKLDHFQLIPEKFDGKRLIPDDVVQDEIFFLSVPNMTINNIWE